LVDAHHAPQNVTRSWAIQPPRNTEVLVLDTPARPDLDNLSPLLREATAILLPVLTAEFDLHAIATTVQQLQRMLPSKQTIAMVLNRVPRTVTTARQADVLTKQLRLPVIGSLRNSCNYLNAAGQGLGMVEMHGAHYKGDQKDIARIAEWCAGKTSGKPVRQFRQISPETIALACSA
jgi:chromosome partitioning protein